MSQSSSVKPVPWDKAAFGVDCFEIVDPSPEVLAGALARPGHYTVRVDPLASKQALHEHGFYYCDTLLEPWCTRDRLLPARLPETALVEAPDAAALLAICHGAFRHGRFHRDFRLARAAADLRYDRWLEELCRERTVYGLARRGTLVGFVACANAKLVLHAMSPAARGRGWARAFWTLVCERLFGAGHAEVTSSISAANLAALNLYASLGFRFRNPVDLYHRMVP